MDAYRSMIKNAPTSTHPRKSYAHPARTMHECKLNYQCSLAQAHAITYMPAYNSTCAHMRARNREGATCMYGLLFGRSNSRIPVQMHASTLSHTLNINTPHTLTHAYMYASTRTALAHVQASTIGADSSR